MDKNAAKIIANSYVSTYRINANDLDGSINIIRRDYNKQNYYIYKKICELANISFVITAEKFFDVETDAEQTEKLLKDLTNMFLIKNIRSRRVNTGRCTTSNLYRTIRVFNQFTKYEKIVYNYYNYNEMIML